MKKPITEFKLESRSKKELWSLFTEHIYLMDDARLLSRQELIEMIKDIREKIKAREE